MSHGLPLDWYEEHDGERLVLNSEKVSAEVAKLHQKLSEATKLIDEGTDAMARLMDAEMAWPNWFPASPADIQRGDELFIGGYTWTLQGDDGPKEYKYRDGRWYRLSAPTRAHQVPTTSQGD